MLTAKKMPEAEQDALLTALVEGHTRADLVDADRAMLDYAVKLTRQPWTIERADVDALRQHGFSDRGVHDICSITGYFAFVNRIADGLGVELEDEHRND